MRGILQAVSSSVLVAFAALAASACSSGDVPAGTEAVTGSVASPIINGTLDTTHQAVVAIISEAGNQQGLCTGTIFKVDAATKIGWVLTAAHCVTPIPPSRVLLGNDYDAPGAVRYEVLDHAFDGRYSGSGDSYDLAVIRILGVDASTPTIPLAATPDNLTTGTSVLSVGYGRTSLRRAGAGDRNSVRRKVTKSLSGAGATTIKYSMTTSGICQGDSGGPVLVNVGGVEKVVGVHSYVANGSTVLEPNGDPSSDCDGEGVSGRVATAGTSIVNEMTSKAAPAASCDLCSKIANSGNNECAVLERQCTSDPACLGYFQCVNECGNTASCRASCLQKFPKGEGPLAAVAACVCTQACAKECGSGINCRSVPKCGAKLPAGACSTCTEGACCQETFDCTADGTCYLCLKGNDADPACATNAKRKALATCVASKCKDACAGSGLDTGAEPAAEEPPPADAAPGTRVVTTEEGCRVATPGATSTTSSPGLTGLTGLATALVAWRRRRTRRTGTGAER